MLVAEPKISWLTIALCVLSVAYPGVLVAQHPIDVQRKSANAEYFEALLAYDKMPKRIATSESTIAAGRSAWALGLTQRAIDEFDAALRNEKLDPTSRARLSLSRGIIEFQEERYQTALLYAQRAVQSLEQAGPLRGRVWLLWAQSLAQLGSYGAAAEKYTLALAEVKSEDLPDVHFLAGECELHLGRNEEARQHFESVPLQHERTAEAMRNLGRIALESGKFSNAAFWLKKGRADYPDSFLDSWVDYALMQAAIHEKDENAIKTISEEAVQRYPPSDFWLNMMNAELQASKWKQFASF